jgi:hypothetical protein
MEPQVYLNWFSGKKILFVIHFLNLNKQTVMSTRFRRLLAMHVGRHAMHVVAQLASL